VIQALAVALRLTNMLWNAPSKAVVRSVLQQRLLLSHARFEMFCRLPLLVSDRFFRPGPCRFQEDLSEVDQASLEELRKAMKLREDVRCFQLFF